MDENTNIDGHWHTLNTNTRCDYCMRAVKYVFVPIPGQSISGKFCKFDCVLNALEHMKKVRQGE